MTGEPQFVDCENCFGLITQMPDQIWTHEDGQAGCYTAMPQLAWPSGQRQPGNYEQRAATYWQQTHPAWTGHRSDEGG